MINAYKKIMLVAILCCMSQLVKAEPVTFNYAVGGFSNGGTVHGSFTGEDLNGDGYISSFVGSSFDEDFEGSMFQRGLNEVTHANMNFNGYFEASVETGGEQVPITQVSTSNDLTDNMPGDILDIFFVLNYKVGSAVLGDDQYEGMLFGTFDQPFVFGLGQFLPIPDGFGIFDSINDLPGGSSLTSALINNSSQGSPCQAGSTCGVIHSVHFDENWNVVVGGQDFTSEYAMVSSPVIHVLFGLSLFALLAYKPKHSFTRKAQKLS